MASAVSRAAGLTPPREAAHIAALGAWVAGNFAGPTARWEAIVAEHPRDVLGLKLAQYGWFYADESKRIHAAVARALPAWQIGCPLGFILGCHVFGLEEAGEYDAAEHTGREAVEFNQVDI